MKGIPHKTSTGLEYTEFAIPKKNGKVRRIFAPSPELLQVQQVMLPTFNRVLSDIEKKEGIQNIFHGFVKDRNPVTAATEHIGYDLTLMMDISNFFDSVTGDHILNISELVHSTRRQLEQCLHFQEGEGGFTAQGFATSPILANICITPIVKEIQEYLDTKFKDRYAFTIYADDIQISINSSDFIPETERIIDIVSYLFESEGFEINQNKTRIRHAKFGHRRILGVNVGDDKLYASRKTIRKIRAARHQKNGPSLGGLITWSKCMLPKNLRPERPKVGTGLKELSSLMYSGELNPEQTVQIASHIVNATSHYTDRRSMEDLRGSLQLN